MVRIKPLGTGRGERGAAGGASAVSARGTTVTVQGCDYTFPTYVATAETSQEELYDDFMTGRVDAFFDGYNVNVLAYGQTGTGKTHTTFGPPGTMARAGAGDFGADVIDDYGLFPRGMFAALARLHERRASGDGRRYVLTCAAVELGLTGNNDMFDATKSAAVANSYKIGGVSGGVAVDRTAKPPRLYGQYEHVVEEEADVLRVFEAIAARNTAATLMNDTSSRSHCFVWLSLHAYDPRTDKVQLSRFQFVDLAGSERMKDAHGVTNWKEGGMAAFEGVLTNFALFMLHQCVNDIRSQRRKGKDHNKISYNQCARPRAAVAPRNAAAVLTSFASCVAAAARRPVRLDPAAGRLARRRRPHVGVRVPVAGTRQRLADEEHDGLRQELLTPRVPPPQAQAACAGQAARRRRGGHRKTPRVAGAAEARRRARQVQAHARGAGARPDAAVGRLRATHGRRARQWRWCRRRRRRRGRRRSQGWRGCRRRGGRRGGRRVGRAEVTMPP